MTDALQELTTNIAELATGATTAVEYTRAPGNGADGIHRRNPTPGTYRVTHPPLLMQLVAALPPGSADPTNGSSRGKPGSKLPVATPVSDALARITRDATTLRNQLREAVPTNTRPRPGLTATMFEIRGLVHATNDRQWAEAAARATREWVRRARTALAYDAPIATLRDLRCRYCGGALRVRSDASSDVWCATSDCRDEGGNPPRWPKETWFLLLEGGNT